MPPAPDPPAVTELRRPAFRHRASLFVVQVGSFFGLVYFLVYFLINSSFAVRVFDEMVNGKLFKGSIGWERLAWGPLPWRLRILNPAIIGADGDVIISATEVRASIVLPALLRPAIWAEDIEVRSPRVRLEIEPRPDPFGHERTWVNIADVFAHPTDDLDDGLDGWVPHLRFTNARVRDARVTIDVGGVYIETIGANVDGAEFELTPDMTIRMGAERARVRGVDVRVAVGDDPTPARNRADDALYRWRGQSVSVRNYWWLDNHFGASSAAGRVEGDPFEIRGFEMDVGRPGIPWMKGHATVQTDDMAIHIRQFGVDAVSGPGRASVRGEGEIDSFVGQFEAEGGPLRAFDFEAASWRVSGRGHENVFDVASLEIDAYGGALSLQGAFEGERGALWADVDLREIAPQTLPVPLPPTARTLIEGKISGRLALRGVDVWGDRPGTTPGSWRQPAFAALASVELDRTGRSRYAPTRPVSLRTTARYSAGRLTLPELTAESRADRVTASGEIDFTASSLDLAGRARSAQIAPYVTGHGAPVSGEVTIRYRLAGPFDNLVAKGHLDAERVRISKFPVREAHIDFALALGRQRLTVSAAKIAVARGIVGASGHIDFGARRLPLDLKLHLSNILLGELPLPERVLGRLNGTARIVGPAMSPRITHCDLTVKRPRWRGLSFSGLDIEGGGDLEAILIERLELRRSNVHTLLSARGQVDLRERTFNGRLDVTKLTSDLISEALGRDVPFQGSLSAELGGAGTFDNPRGGGHVTLTGVGISSYWLGDADLDVRAEGGGLDIKGRLFDLATLDAAIPVVPGGPPARATLELTRVDLHERLPQLVANQITASINGNITVIADPYDLGPDNIDVEAQFDELAVTFGGVEIRNAGQVEASFRHGALTLDSVVLDVADQPLACTGSIGLDGDLNVGLAGEVNLDVFQPFVKDVFSRFEGAVTLTDDLTVSGTLDDPMPAGHFVLERAYITPRVSTIGREIIVDDPVEFEIVPIEGPRQSIGEFNIFTPRNRGGAPDDPESGEPNTMVLRRDDGTIDVDRVEVFFTEFIPRSLIVWFDATNISVRVPQVVRGTFDGDGLVFEMWDITQLDRAGMRLSGDVEVLGANYTADVFSSSEISRGVRERLTGRSSAARVKLIEKAPILKRFWLDLNVRGEQDIFLRNQVAVFAMDVELRPTIRIQGLIFDQGAERSEDRMGLTGTVTAVPDTSTISYAGREFELLAGQVVFGDGNFVEAQVHAEATIRARRTFEESTVDDQLTSSQDDFTEEIVNMFIRFRMKTRDSPLEVDWTFESSGGLSDIEVLTLVLTGRYDLTGDASAQPALEIALGPLLDLIERPLEETLDVELDVVPQTSGVVEVDVDKELFDRLRVFSRATVGDTEGGNELEIGALYQLNNSAFGELTNERIGPADKTTARIRFRIRLD